MEFLDSFKGNGRQVLAVTTGTLAAISDGMGYGWSSPVVPYLTSNASHIEITHYQGGWLETIVLLGAFCGLPFTIYFVGKIGRKYSMQLTAVTALISWIIVCWARSFAWLMIGRFLIGLAGDMCFVAAPMYIAEISDPKIRGFLSSVIYLMMLSGILIVYCVGAYAPYYATCAIGMGLTITQLVVFSFMPESAYYHLQRNDVEKAKKSLRWLRPTIDADAEIREIEASIERQNTENKATGKVQDLVMVASNRKAILIMTVLNGGQHFAGTSVLFMNLHMILGEAGSVYFDPKMAGIVFAVILLVSASVASVMMDQFGRKVLLIVSGFLTACCLLAIAVYFHLKASGADVSAVSWAPAAAAVAYAVVFKLGLGMVPIVVTAEIFPQAIKAVGMTLADVTYVAVGIGCLQLYHAMAGAVGIHAPFYLFAACTAAGCAFTYFYVPETKGKTLDEIQRILEGREGEPVGEEEKGRPLLTEKV